MSVVPPSVGQVCRCDQQWAGVQKIAPDVNQPEEYEAGQSHSHLDVVVTFGSDF